MTENEKSQQNWKVDNQNSQRQRIENYTRQQTKE